MNSLIKVAILGSTGSIGTQALDVIANNSEIFEVVALTARGSSVQSAELFEHQCNTFLRGKHKQNYALASISPDKMLEFANKSVTDADIVLNAIAGNVGLEASLIALESGAKLALANKESMVIGGNLFAKWKNEIANLLDFVNPVDSEHSAIWQSLDQSQFKSLEKLILTASGGPFRGKSADYLQNVTPEMALNHPTWKMGQLVTVNSATLMNKALELVEAAYLFGVSPAKIDVVIHKQSIVHSGVQYSDGSCIFQATPPSMKLPIAVALNTPEFKQSPQHLQSNIIDPLDFLSDFSLDFEPVDDVVFRAIVLARYAFESGPMYLTVMNAVNENAVYAFLRGEISFTRIIAKVEESLNTFDPHKFAIDPQNPTLDEIKHLLNVYNC